MRAIVGKSHQMRPSSRSSTVVRETWAAAATLSGSKPRSSSWSSKRVGAHNSVAGADQGFRAPSWDQESVRDSVHEDSASARIAAGQRPRPSFRHPHPSLRPHYRALTATTSRSAPVPRIGTLALAVFAACGSPSRGQKPWPSLSGRQVLLFHASACDELTPPIHRTPPGPHTGSSPTEGPPRRAFVPRPPTDPSFDAIVISFRCVSSGSHMFVFSSHTRPATARRQPQRSPPRLLTDAACGGLESPPPRRPRRTYLHHWHSTDRADDLLHHHHHFPSGHTWVPETRPWSLTCRDAGRC